MSEQEKAIAIIIIGSLFIEPGITQVPSGFSLYILHMTRYKHFVKLADSFGSTY